MYTTLSVSRSYLYSVARACDANHINRKDCAAVILFCAENATKVALDAIQILGNFFFIFILYIFFIVTNNLITLNYLNRGKRIHK